MKILCRLYSTTLTVLKITSYLKEILLENTKREKIKYIFCLRNVIVVYLNSGINQYCIYNIASNLTNSVPSLLEMKQFVKLDPCQPKLNQNVPLETACIKFLFKLSSADRQA